MVPTATTPLSRYTLRSRLRHIGQPLGKRERVQFDLRGAVS
jgi:hypothetical protein